MITGPDFKGESPGEMIRVRTRTKFGAVAVRIFVNGEADLPNAIEAQKGFHLMPLSAYLREGLGYQRPQAAALSPYTTEAPEALRFFDELGHWMGLFLPKSADLDDAVVATSHLIGLSVAKGFAWQLLD